MRACLCVCATALLLSPGAAHAVSEASVEAASVVQEKADRDARSISMAESLRRVEASRAEAEKRVERIRNLPPERLQDWIDGKLSEADLERVTRETPASQRAVEAASVVPSEHVKRLVLVSLAVVALAFLYGRQRRRERTETRK